AEPRRQPRDAQPVRAARPRRGDPRAEEPGRLMIVRELVALTLNGTDRDGLRDDLAEIEVEEHVDSADVFRLRFAIGQQSNRAWRHLDDPDLAVWNRLAIQAGYPGNRELLVD